MRRTQESDFPPDEQINRKKTMGRGASVASCLWGGEEEESVTTTTGRQRPDRKFSCPALITPRSDSQLNNTADPIHLQQSCEN